MTQTIKDDTNKYEAGFYTVTKIFFSNLLLTVFSTPSVVMAVLFHRKYPGRILIEKLY
jgi:hypothetical protein